MPGHTLQNDGACYLLGKNAERYLARAYRLAARSYDTMGPLNWPPLPEDLAYDPEPPREPEPDEYEDEEPDNE